MAIYGGGIGRSFYLSKNPLMKNKEIKSIKMRILEILVKDKNTS